MDPQNEEEADTTENVGFVIALEAENGGGEGERATKGGDCCWL